MKNLDRFSHFERSIRGLLTLIAAFGIPIAFTYFIDLLFLREFPVLARYSLLAVCIVVGLIFGIGFGFGFSAEEALERSFAYVRKILGLKPLRGIESEVETKRTEIELQQKKQHDWFTSRSDKEQRYSIWMLQKQQCENLKLIDKVLEPSNSCCSLYYSLH